MNIFKNVFGKKSNKTESGKQSEINIDRVSGASNVEVSEGKKEINTDNYVERDNNGNMAGRDINIHYHGSKEEQSYIEKYLNRLMNDCGGIEWLKLIKIDQQQTAQKIKLDSVYVPLLTETQKQKEHNRWENKPPYSAVEMLNREQKLVVSGDPGSGKSVFVNFVILCLAGDVINDPLCNLTLLTKALPDEEGKRDGKQQQWSKEHKGLIPLRVILRDFVSSRFFPKPDESVNAQQLLDFIAEDLKENSCEDCFPALQTCLNNGRVLLLLDGLDEVSDAGERRERMKHCIEEFCITYFKNRFLVTVRPYAYQQSEWHLSEFTETKLADFNRGQVLLFIEHWYQPCNCPELAVDEANNRAVRLKSATKEGAIAELAKKPLFLTLIGFLHRHNHELPDRRGKLYERLLELLIQKWEAARFKIVEGDVEKALKLEQKSLAHYLQVGFDSIVRVLQGLAFDAHAQQAPENKGTADIAAKDLSHALYCLADDQHQCGKQAIDLVSICAYLRDRVGVLYQRGGNSDMEAVYSFPHRSFQEYLAAECLGRGDNTMKEKYGYKKIKWYDIAASLLMKDTERWREVVVLAGAIHSGTESMEDLINALIEGIEPNNDLTLEQSWGLRFAGEILAENIKQNRDCSYLEDLQLFLPKLLSSNTLPAQERVTAGKHLAKIGDRRSEIMGVDSMQFCVIPSGEFYLGVDDSKYEDEKNGGLFNIDYVYAMARYPVTVAQYRQFVDATNHQPVESYCLKGLDNTPVVYVTWNEAIKFCDWLTTRWIGAGFLPEKGWRVDLASEPEWEKAARGGLQTPKSSKIMSIADNLIQSVHNEIELQDNLLEKRIYPYGNEIDIERVNYGESGINAVSSLGCYSLGKSPYGCEEMAGNVWEWTRSAYVESYSVNHSEWKQRNARVQNEVGRVLRGGAFYDFDVYVRCSARNDDSPDYRQPHWLACRSLSPYL